MLYVQELRVCFFPSPAPLYSTFSSFWVLSLCLEFWLLLLLCFISCFCLLSPPLPFLFPSFPPFSSCCFFSSSSFSLPSLLSCVLSSSCSVFLSSAWLSFPYWTCFNSNSPCPRFTFYLELHNANLLGNKIVRSEISCYNETIQEKGAPLIPYDAVLKGEERLWNRRAQGEPVWRWRHT